MSGRAETQNNHTVNGFDNNDQSVDVPSVRPSIDDIQEFKLLTGIYQAEYGRSVGAQVVVVTKSGEHSCTVPNLRISAERGTRRRELFYSRWREAVHRRKCFGANLGGPIKKDKTFFHFSYEGLRLVQQVAATGTVPTAAEVAGNFSTLLTAKTPIIIKNPLTGVAFPGNIIPSNLISSVGQSLLSQYPAASLPRPLEPHPTTSSSIRIRPNR